MLVVGVAIAGRGPDGRAPEPAGIAPAVADASHAPAASPRAKDQPARPEAHWPPVRTTPTWAMGRPRTVLVVRGLVPRDAGDLRVRLETAHGDELAVSRLDPTGHGHAGIIPFEAIFRIDRRPTGADPPLFVVVVDGADEPVGSGRRAYASSLFLDLRAIGRDGGRASGAASMSALPRSRGNDGLVGASRSGSPSRSEAARSGTAEGPAPRPDDFSRPVARPLSP